MKSIVLFLVFVAALVGASTRSAASSDRPIPETAPVSEAAPPVGYRDWRLISVAREEGELDDVRAILGNDLAVKAYREGTLPFPDGSIIARIAWRYEPSEENNKVFGKAQSFVAGAPKNGLQFMIKDSKKYAATGGWAFSQFDDGKPLENAKLLNDCFTCHALEPRDLVFTKYAR